VNPLYLHLGVKVALAIALVGIFARKRHTECWMLPVYLVVVLVCDSAVALFPAQLFHWNVSVVQIWTYNLLAFGVALELARRAFQAFPGAAATARWVFLAILVITGLSIFAATPPAAVRSNSNFYVTALLTFQPRLINATIWLFVVTARLVIFFNIPVSNWHRSVSLSFTTYLVVSVTLLNLMKSFGWNIQSFVNFFDGSAYLALCCWWALSAWQKSEATEVVPASVHRLAAARA
jgi:hypothetical protein